MSISEIKDIKLKTDFCIIQINRLPELAKKLSQISIPPKPTTFEFSMRTGSTHPLKLRATRLNHADCARKPASMRPITNQTLPESPEETREDRSYALSNEEMRQMIERLKALSPEEIKKRLDCLEKAKSHILGILQGGDLTDRLSRHHAQAQERLAIRLPREEWASYLWQCECFLDALLQVGEKYSFCNLDTLNESTERRTNTRMDLQNRTLDHLPYFPFGECYLHALHHPSTPEADELLAATYPLQWSFQNNLPLDIPRFTRELKRFCEAFTAYDAFYTAWYTDASL
ncbi:MAG: hypothetical protein JSS61_06665 [Verrucomicrobia bacterium]|nr:hypothetical protein [Verrucomicrobiota bacterium]